MIKGDSTEYNLLRDWCETAPLFDTSTRILTCEIGVREGLGSKIIMDCFKERLQEKEYKHIGIDPYNNLKYQHYDHTPAYTCDYTEEMRQQMVKDFKDYKEFDFKNMTDVQFMYEFYWTQPYHFVHFDGPHMTKDVLTEAIFFANRSVKGTRFVFDDYPKYQMDQIAFALTYFDFKTKEAGENKIMLERHA